LWPRPEKPKGRGGTEGEKWGEGRGFNRETKGHRKKKAFYKKGDLNLWGVTRTERPKHVREINGHGHWQKERKGKSLGGLPPLRGKQVQGGSVVDGI